MNKIDKKGGGGGMMIWSRKLFGLFFFYFVMIKRERSQCNEDAILENNRWLDGKVQYLESTNNQLERWQGQRRILDGLCK